MHYMHGWAPGGYLQGEMYGVLTLEYVTRPGL